MKTRYKTDVLIIGGGVTGAGIARDLALRGISSILVEKHDINAGASGANHGLLHSGARYVFSDPDTAKECMTEGKILKRVAPDCIEDTGGLFIAVKGDSENHVADFPCFCEKSRINAKEIDPADVLEMEPALSKKVIAAFYVPDSTIDPFRLSLENINQARGLCCRLLRHTKVISFSVSKRQITSTTVANLLTGEKFAIEANQVVNAAGAWAKEIAGFAGIDISMIYSKGSLLVANSRITKRVINRLRPSSNGDIMVPAGTVSIIGSTSVRIETLDKIYPTVREMDLIIGQEAKMIPALEKTRFIRAYSGVRPLAGAAPGDDRNASRGFTLIDHSENRVENFITITGGKLTTYRLMAEKAVDLVCKRLSLSVPCMTRSAPLPSSKTAKWTNPGLAPRLWFKKRGSDPMMCECEMTPQSIVDEISTSIRGHGGNPDLLSIGLRSRVGKGACQGTFCSLRLAAYLYDTGEFKDDKGLDSLRDFLNERWRGIRPLLWGASMMQAELQEALHCGFLGLELKRHSIHLIP